MIFYIIGRKTSMSKVSATSRLMESITEHIII